MNMIQQMIDLNNRASMQIVDGQLDDAVLKSFTRVLSAFQAELRSQQVQQTRWAVGVNDGEAAPPSPRRCIIQLAKKPTTSSLPSHIATKGISSVSHAKPPRSAATDDQESVSSFHVIQNPVLFLDTQADDVDSLRICCTGVIFNIAIHFLNKYQAGKDKAALERAHSMFTKVLQCQANDEGSVVLPSHLASASCLLNVAATNNLAYIHQQMGRSPQLVMECVRYLDYLLNYPSCSMLLMDVVGMDGLKELHLNVFCFEVSMTRGWGAAVA